MATAFINYVISMTNLSSSPVLLLYDLGQILATLGLSFLIHQLVPASSGHYED